MEIHFGASAQRFLNNQPHHIVNKLLDDVLWLRDNPHLAPDDPRKKPFYAPPVYIREFCDDVHWIPYYTDNVRLVVANIGTVSEPRHLHRIS